MNTTSTVIAIVSALLLVGGFVWYQLEYAAKAKQIIGVQQDALRSQHDKIAAEQALRLEKAKQDQEAMYADAQRIAEISDADERRKAALEAVKKAIDRRKAAGL